MYLEWTKDEAYGGGYDYAAEMDGPPNRDGLTRTFVLRVHEFEDGRISWVVSDYFGHRGYAGGMSDTVDQAKQAAELWVQQPRQRDDLGRFM